MNVDKNKAIIDYILTCPQVRDSAALYFNFINAKNDTTQIVTNSNDVYNNRTYIDGSVARRYTFTLITFRSVSENPVVVSLQDYSNENVVDLDTIQGLIDWIREQNDLHNFPDFGDTCDIQSIETTTDSPNLDGINSEVTPMLAMYSITIQVDYIDTSKKIWG